jgi:hypothetical protein
MTNAASYVLGGGFFSEVYSGVKEKMSGKQQKEVEEVLHGVEGELIFDAPGNHLTVIDRTKPGKTWSTDGEGLGPGETWETSPAQAGKPQKNELREGFREVAVEMDKATQQIKEFAGSMPRALFEVAKFGGEGVVDLGRGYGKMFTWMADQFRSRAASRENSPEDKPASETETQILGIGAERLDRAATEADEIVSEAVKAKKTLEQTVASSREGFLKMIDDAEAKLVRRNKLLDNPELKGQERDEVKSDMARLERDIDKYEAGLAAIAAKEKRDAEDNNAQRIYKKELSNAKILLRKHKEALNQRSDKNEQGVQPFVLTGKAREIVERRVEPLEARVAKYESIVAALEKLENLKPEANKESAVA